MKPLAARSPRTRQTLAWTVAGLALALPLLAIGAWIAALAAQYEARTERLSGLHGLETRIAEARAEASAHPHLALVSDPDQHVSLRSISAAEAHLAAQAGTLAGRLEAAGLQPALSREALRTTYGEIDEVRITLTARGDRDAILQTLAAGAAPDLRIASFRLEPLEGHAADLTLVLVRSASHGGADAG